MRLYEVAKKMKLSNEELIDLLKAKGFSVKSHMSGMTDEMIAAVSTKAKTKTKTKTAKTTTKKKAIKTKTADKPAEKKATASPPTSAKAPTSAKSSKTAKAPKTPSKAKPADKPTARSDKASVRESARKAVRNAVSKKGVPKTGAAPARSSSPPDKRAHPPSDSRRKRETKTDAQQKAVRESVRRTLAKMEATKRTRRRKAKPKEIIATEEPAIRVTEGSTVEELATALNVEYQDIVERVEDIGGPPPTSQGLDKDTIELLADDLDMNVHVASDAVEDLIQVGEKVDESRLTPRAPIVTVMGHVDHGKTSILDYIRKTRVASGEAGGITQHIGAYQVDTPVGAITFIDTPGHEAFTSMRARGAQVTDIVVLVVAADDGVMPQTVEAINHAKAADVPLIVAVNKMDLPNANSTQIRQQLTERDVVVEDFGGDVVSVDVSAKTGDGIDKLLEMILLQAELMELTADSKASAQAVAVEVRKEEGRGVLCTALVLQGTLCIGDAFVVGSDYGKVRALLDDTGHSLKNAGPSSPVLVLGCNGLPEAGDRFVVVKSEREARDLSVTRQEKLKNRERNASGQKLTLEELYSQIQSGELKELRLLVKGDTDGSVEAVAQSLDGMEIEEVSVKVLHSGVGVVGESDVLLAASSEAIIIGFNVKVSPKALEAAKREKVEIKLYSVIYEAIQDVDDAMKGLLEPERVERILGRAEVRKVYKISRLGQIAGSFVLEGSMTRNASVRVLRADEQIAEGKISSLKRFQDDAREVQKDFECGIGVSGFDSLQEGDVIEAFVIEEKARVF